MKAQTGRRYFLCYFSLSLSLSLSLSFSLFLVNTYSFARCLVPFTRVNAALVGASSETCFSCMLREYLQAFCSTWKIHSSKLDIISRKLSWDIHFYKLDTLSEYR
ncbi:hypothetical protein P5V15_006770 [Pogonomyrmex californicus]